MNLKTITLAAAAGFAVLGTAPVFANPPGWSPAHGWRANHHAPQHHNRVPAYVYYQPRPVYVPPPVVYYPPPVIYRRVPPSPGLRVGFRFRL